MYVALRLSTFWPRADGISTKQNAALDTSRRPRDNELNGNTYHFTTRSEMEVDVKAGRFLEHGEYDGNLYGTKIESIHEVVAAGRTCILDVNPQVRGGVGGVDPGRSRVQLGGLFNLPCPSARL